MTQRLIDSNSVLQLSQRLSRGRYLAPSNLPLLSQICSCLEICPFGVLKLIKFFIPDLHPPATQYSPAH